MNLIAIFFLCVWFTCGCTNVVCAFTIPPFGRKPRATRTCRTFGGIPHQPTRLLSTNDYDSNDTADPMTSGLNEKQPPNKSPVHFFEGAVQHVTGNDDYKFGDYTKKTLSDLTGKNVETEGYQFGDITKQVLSKTGQAVTGDATYQFGDITKAKLAELEHELERFRNDTFSDLPTAVWRQMFQGLNLNQRRALVVALLQMMAIGLLSWGVMANMCTCGVITMAWTRTCLTAATSSSVAAQATIPLVPLQQTCTRTMWRSFLSNYSTTRLLLDPLLLVIKGIGTLMIYPRYQRLIHVIQQKWITARQRKTYPLLYRGAALGIGFFVMNVMAFMMLAGIGFGVGGAAARLLVRFSQ